MPAIFKFPSRFPALCFIILLLVPCVFIYAESFRTTVEGSVAVSYDRPSENPVSLGINSSLVISLDGELRFLKGIELEITAPQSWLQYRGSLVMNIYNNINPVAGTGLMDVVGTRVAYEALPSRLRIIYHIPIRAQSGLRTTTTVTVPSSVIQPAAFPVVFRLMQIGKGLSDDFDRLRFSAVVRPILSDEGAVRLVPRFSSQLRNRPFTVLINDNVIQNISELVFLREGENHLVVFSDDYRNISRRFIVEKGKIIDLIIDLLDSTPIIIFEAPQNAQIFLNNTPVTRTREGMAVEPGSHEVRFQIGDYTMSQTINVQRGMTYRVTMAVDMIIQEEE